MNMKNILFELSRATAAGKCKEAANIAYKHLSQFADCEQKGLTVTGKMKGNTDYTIMLDAHIDEIAFIVTNVDDDGFLTVSNCGGFDLRTLPARSVTVHGKYEIPAVFCSTPPHLSKDDIKFDDIANFKIDTLLGAKAKEVVGVGDMVTLRAEPTALVGSRVTGKSFDDRAGVVCLLEVASRLKDKELPVNVVFSFSDQEELGCRGSKTATFEISPQEAIALDVSFGTAPDVSKQDGGELSGGAMVGFSPVLDSGISNKLTEIAKQNGIKYQTEVMGGRTGTNSDVISISKEGVKTGLLSIPLRNMHTDVEVIDLADLESVCDILEKYILSGGSLNA